MEKPIENQQSSQQLSTLTYLNSLEKIDNKNCPIKPNQNFQYTYKQTCFCMNLNAIIAQQSEDVQVMFKQLKPFLFGKIPFAPNTSPFIDLIKRVNTTFHSLDSISKLIGQVVNLSDNFMQKYKLKTPNGFGLAIQNLTVFLHEFFDYEITQVDVATLKLLSDNLDFYSEVLNFAKNLIQCLELDKFEGFDSEAEAVKVGIDRMNNDTFWAAVIFANNNETLIKKSTSLPKIVNYKIRMNNFHIQEPRNLYKPFYIYEPENCLTCNPYFSYGFIYLQDMIEKAVIEMKTNKTQDFGLAAQMTPYPCYLQDFFLSGVSKPLPLFIVLAWTYTVSKLVQWIVHEKERRLKEFMQIMGLSNGAYWLAWYIYTLLFLILIIGILTAVMKVGQIAVYSEFSAVFVFYVCFAIATTSQCHLMSVFFDRANLAAVVSGIMYFLLYLPYMMLLNFADQMKLWQKMAISLSSTVAYGYGNELIAVFEFQNQGLKWSNFDSTPYNLKRDQFTMKYICIVLLIDAFIYSLCAWYIEGVWPGEFGVAKRWYFPLQPSYWMNRPFKIRQEIQNLVARNPRLSFLLIIVKLMNTISSSKQEIVEEEANKFTPISYLDDTIEKTEIEDTPGIEIINLHKVYSRKKTHALKGLNVNFYQNEISAFLGHNGAGKSLFIF
jgi:ABC-type multidrug transport system fused ATPase/permease subunit